MCKSKYTKCTRTNITGQYTELFDFFKKTDNQSYDLE